ncbi:hypothetical protein [Williamsia sterculiae]|uniref:Uncharacterized protein n=1 Tax=Williamsia sterculiae TaxID=1344003 RepID=A0A1N7CP62_9NOCA|nr:hypothetical protein [Williamsia sterculiae]SIR65406.1 hypothetical protein SAMN05445060_0268 [Williamsia sterculiae]
MNGDLSDLPVKSPTRGYAVPVLVDPNAALPGRHRRSASAPATTRPDHSARVRPPRPRDITATTDIPALAGSSRIDLDVVATHRWGRAEVEIVCAAVTMMLLAIGVVVGIAML